MRLIFSTFLLVSALPVTAQIYHYTDANGNRVYTDQPPIGASVSNLELSTINSVPSEMSQPSGSTIYLNSASKHSTFYSRLHIVELPTDQAIRANDGSFTVQVEITPNLDKQHRLQLVIDGKVYGEASHSTTLLVENLDRGEHRLAVQVLANEQILQHSAEQTINVQRMHINRLKPIVQ